MRKREANKVELDETGTTQMRERKGAVTLLERVRHVCVSFQCVLLLDT